MSGRQEISSVQSAPLHIASTPAKCLAFFRKMQLVALQGGGHIPWFPSSPNAVKGSGDQAPIYCCDLPLPFESHQEDGAVSIFPLVTP